MEYDDDESSRKSFSYISFKLLCASSEDFIPVSTKELLFITEDFTER
jgi:hypothetical protein